MGDHNNTITKCHNVTDTLGWRRMADPSPEDYPTYGTRQIGESGFNVPIWRVIGCRGSVMGCDGVFLEDSWRIAGG